MADQNKEETAPLLSNEHSNSSAPPAYTPYPGNDAGGSQAGVVVTVPPIGPDELPPPYTPTPQGTPTINCKVCQALINIEGKLHQHVVKCTVCNEATPIKAPPPGKKYVRCPCNCLLICKSTSQRIACPRANCKRIINLGPTQTTITIRSPGSSRVICGHCSEAFLFNINNNALARCPRCRKVSSVGPGYARRRAIIFGLIGLFFLAAGIGVTVGTLELAEEHGGIYVVWVGAYIVGVLNLLRCLYYICMTVSKVEGPA